MRYTYDAEGRITSWTDRNNTTYWYTYDEHGRVIATGGTGNALASTLAYDDATRTTRVSDSVGHTRVYEHKRARRVRAARRPDGPDGRADPPRVDRRGQADPPHRGRRGEGVMAL
ncbi:RHS repeat domain-containing protein [Streptomyces tibetensis]|uniref:RHS repeat domain-containing protein n=1 Tax=Streptomyces tibetensis TaxID=2382123 RepID=UPI003F4D3C41